jgi:hypothetical protein
MDYNAPHLQRLADEADRLYGQAISLPEHDPAHELAWDAYTDASVAYWDAAHAMEAQKNG